MRKYLSWIGDKDAREKVFALLRYVNVVRDLVLDSHYTLQNIFTNTIRIEVKET